MRMFVEPELIYLHHDSVDFRKSINGLSLLVEQEMILDLYSQAIFLYCNKGHDKLKVLYWDKTGFALWYKRLEKQKFKWPKQGESTLHLSAQQLDWLLAGFDVIGHQTLHYKSQC